MSGYHVRLVFSFYSFFVVFLYQCLCNYLLCCGSRSCTNSLLPPYCNRMLMVCVHIFDCSILGRIRRQQFWDRNGLASSVLQHQQPWLWWFLWLMFIFSEFTLSHFFPQWAVNVFERDAFMRSQNKQKSSPRNECDIPWKQKRAIHFIVAKDCEGFSKHVGVNPAWVSLAEQHLDLVEID